MKPRQKLIWLGLKRPSKNQSVIAGTTSLLKKHIGDFSTFQNGTSNQTSYAEFKTYLKNNGFTQKQADDFVSKAKSNFSDTDNSGSTWDEFKSYVTNDASSYQDLKSKFANTSTLASELETTSGGSAAGVRVFEHDGVTRDGVSVPAGTVEVFGREVHFSQSDTAKTNTGSGSTGSEPSFTVSNLSTDDSDNTVDVYNSITISADITNNGNYLEFYEACLIEDGTTISSKSLHIGAGATETVSFTVSKEEYVCHDYQIDSSSTVTVCWTPPELVK